MGRTAAGSLALILVLCGVGCATDYVSRTSTVRRAYESYDYDRALDSLASREKREDERIEDGRHPDTLLYLLDRGMILHAAGDFEESNRVLHQAERFAASLDIVSVSEEARTLTTNERRRAYRGEDFELLLVNVIKAMNFAALGDREAALVEVRRAHERLRAMVAEEKKPYQQLAIASYMGGVLFEWAGELDSAYIDYGRAKEAGGVRGHLAEPLLRLARHTGRTEEYEALLQQYPDVPHDPLGRDEGQLVVVIGAGLSPEKKPTVREGDVDLLALPMYQRRRWGREHARVSAGQTKLSAETVTNVEQVAVKHLEERIGRMLARSLAGTAVKAGVATAVGAVTKSEDLGFLTFYLMMMSNRPDLRSWLSLPAEYQLARARLPAGRHVVEVRWRGKTTRHEVVVEPGGITVLPLRRY